MVTSLRLSCLILAQRSTQSTMERYQTVYIDDSHSQILHWRGSARTWQTERKSISVDGVVSEPTAASFAVSPGYLFLGHWSSSYILVTSLIFSTAVVSIVLWTLMINKRTVQLKSLISTSLVSTSATVLDWCASRRLQLYTSKTELVRFGSRTSLSKVSAEDLCVETSSHQWPWCMTLLASSWMLSLLWSSMWTALHVAASSSKTNTPDPASYWFIGH